MRLCTIPGCGKPHDSHGLCNGHASRLRRHGDPLVVKQIRGKGTPEERFWQRCVRSLDPDGCWEWLGAHSKGYGRFALTRTNIVLAHRYAYELLRGPIPEGLHIDHLCRFPGCINPWHLEPVTNGENTRRGEGARLTRERYAAITHCPYGHPYTVENTYWGRTARGYHNRRCRICHRERARAKAARE